MKNETTNTAAKVLRTKIRDNALGGNELFNFAKDHALDGKLINEALVLQLNYFTAQPENREPFIGPIESLIEKIRYENEVGDSEKGVAAQEEHKKRALSTYKAMKPEREVVVELKGLGKHYAGKNGFRLAPIDLKFRLGEITGIVGANANGKSTLLRMVVGELLKSSGQIQFPFFQKNKKRSITWGAVKHNLSYIPQEIPEWKSSLRTTLKYEAAIHGIRGKQCDREVDFILERLGLTEDADNKTWRELSGGYKLRFTLAKALVWQPSLLVLDEPLANLDVASQTVILNDLHNLAHSFRHPICVLVTSQHIHEIENIADRLILLDNGHLRYTGKPGQFGADNEFNLFEFQSTMSTESLKSRLRPETCLRLDELGFYYVLRTPKNIESKDILQELTQADVPVSYFRDISHSVKQIFYENPGSA